MLKLEYLRLSEAWRPDAATIQSFAGPCRACRVHGPARLVRLVTFGGRRAPEGQPFHRTRRDGGFWFAESDFLTLKRQAEADLRTQGNGPQLGDRLAMYLRHQFRNLLAVRRDWTPSFDGYLVLSVPARQSLIALVGRINQQPVYGPGFPGEADARVAGIRLAGGLTQYLINFTFLANRAYAWRIMGPFIL